jgi:hypothetical protein
MDFVFLTGLAFFVLLIYDMQFSCMVKKKLSILQFVNTHFFNRAISSGIFVQRLSRFLIFY